MVKKAPAKKAARAKSSSRLIEKLPETPIKAQAVVHEAVKDKLRQRLPFPEVTLEETIKIAQALNEEYQGGPAHGDLIGPTLYSSPEEFGKALKAANQYGIITGEDVFHIIQLTELGKDVVAPTSPDQRQAALLKAFSNVELFRKIVEAYAGQPLPEVEFFKNALERKFEIPRPATQKFIDVFTSNLEFLKAFTPTKTGTAIIPVFGVSHTSTAVQSSAATSSYDTENVREFLDTCFILMPFGDWFDKYYKEIYVPATKDAGFEPLRADGLFKAGSVMEQIWTQIQKAKVLLADLTGKNPNVFYELGLAHALSKPVVFVAGDIEDVPFDVRHLRVVIYDIREPHWAEKLRSEISAYLKNTRSDPDKSIPLPYRDTSPGNINYSAVKKDIVNEGQRETG